MWPLVLLCTFILVNLTDACLTYYGIAYKGHAEGVLVMLFLIKNFGLAPGLIIGKALFISFGFVLYKIYKSSSRNYLRWISIVMLAYFTFIVGGISFNWAVSLFLK